MDGHHNLQVDIKVYIAIEYVIVLLIKQDDFSAYTSFLFITYMYLYVSRYKLVVW